MKVTVTRIIDGDTFKVAEFPSSVRIRGIDTPEKGEPGYEPAINRLKRLIDSGEVELRNEANGYYGRIIADVYVNGNNIIHDL